MRVFTPLPTRHWRSAGPFAAAAEAAGFDAVMTVELGHDPFTPLGFAALATQRVELTTSVAVAFPRSPTVLASQAWDLHANSEGRFVLGLGSQVKGHNERRFGIAWSAPAPRLRDYIGALRAVWRCWETGERLDYQGEHYQLSLMTPDFSPEPTGLPSIPITIAAVGEAMLRVAGEVCDGVRLHPLCSRRYLEEVCLPQLHKGMRRGGRRRAAFDLHGGGFVATGADEQAVATAVDAVRRRIALYGSTRTYLPILSLHGLADLGLKLHRLSVEGRWNEMPAEISDEIVRLFAACGTYGEIAAAIEARFGGLADAIDLSFPADAPAGLQRELMADIRRIPHLFEGFATGRRTAFFAAVNGSLGEEAPSPEGVTIARRARPSSSPARRGWR
jgi:probable F420-dependent oxidoreductase